MSKLLIAGIVVVALMVVLAGIAFLPPLFAKDHAPATDGQSKTAAGAPPAGGPADSTTTTPPAPGTPATPPATDATKKLPIIEGPDGSKTVGDVTRFSLNGNIVVRSKPTYVGEEQTWRSYPVLNSATMADQFVEILAKWQARNIATPDDATEFELTIKADNGQKVYAYLIDNQVKMACKDSDGNYVAPVTIATIVGCNKPAEVFAKVKAELIAERDEMRLRRKANVTRMQETGEIPASS